MLRQSKTTIKELSAQYRSVLKRAFLAGVIALTTSVATANTDVTFAGDYTDNSGTTQNVANGAPGAQNFTYDGTNANGTANEGISSNTTTGVSQANFAYTLADGTTETLESGNTYTAGDYTASTVAGTTGYENVSVADGYGLSAGTTVVDSAYSYENPQYDENIEGSQQYITLDSNAGARALTADYATDPAYTSGSTTITNATTAEDLIGLYSYQAGEGHRYVLSADGTGVRDLDNDGQGVDLDNPAIDPDLKTALQGMLDAYANDSGANLTAATNALNGMQDAENANYAAALGAYNADTAAQETLATNFATYTTATNAYETATNADSNYQQALDNFNANTAMFDAASDVYNAPIESTIDDRAQTVAEAVVADEASARESADADLQDAIDNEASTRADEDAAIRSEFADADDAVRGEFAAADADLQDAIDNEASARADEDTAIRSEFADADDAVRSEFAAADADLRDAIDNEVARATAQEQAIRNDFAAGDAATLARANAYTDQRVDTLEKNVSGGVAAATALSSVAVSNVKRGEVSVGAGYGYYNDQSAVAFGAAMGLTDRWSVNAGAGLATGDKTQMSFRAGTNYKFKLF